VNGDLGESSSKTVRNSGTFASIGLNENDFDFDEVVVFKNDSWSS